MGGCAILSSYAGFTDQEIVPESREAPRTRKPASTRHSGAHWSVSLHPPTGGRHRRPLQSWGSSFRPLGPIRFPVSGSDDGARPPQPQSALGVAPLGPGGQPPRKAELCWLCGCRGEVLQSGVAQPETLPGVRSHNDPGLCGHPHSPVSQPRPSESPAPCAWEDRPAQRDEVLPVGGLFCFLNWR